MIFRSFLLGLFWHLASLSECGDWHLSPARRKSPNTAQKASDTLISYLIVSFCLGNRDLSDAIPPVELLSFLFGMAIYKENSCILMT